MKTRILKSTLVVALFAGVIASCVKDDNYDTPKLDACTETSLVKNREVSQILAGSVVALHQNIVTGQSDVIEAYVTSSDIAGNFFKSISMQTLDGSKAFSVPVDATSTFINYEPGRKVLIKMDGLYTDIKYGGMRIGGLYANSTGAAEVGRLPEPDFKASVNRSCTVVSEDQLVQHVTIAQAATDAYLNKLIEIDNVQFEANAITSTYYDVNNDLGGATNWRIMDMTGSSVIFRTSAYANFAAKPVAQGSGKVRGIMTKYNTDYQFVVRTQNDIDMTGPRFYPLLNESFSGGIAAWNAYSVTGNEVWAYSATFGNPGACAKMSGYANTTNNANEDWLISPIQNLSTLSSAILTFDTAYNYSGNDLVVYISNNYSGTGNPNAAGVTWTPLTATLSPGGWAWTGSGDINISSYTGAGNTAVYVAFKYTSTTSASRTWELDNVRIREN
ncbi:MAG: hypothetical protein RL699_622 [Bacteroidota bacterium]|jgi:hypothetical protein